MDDRTDEEKALGVFPRYSPSVLYISQCPSNRAEYNDIPVVFHQPTYDYLIEHGVDEVLSKHFAHIFSRDPLVVFPDKIDVNDNEFTNHFENFQSTNWNSVRFKPPPGMNSLLG